MEFRRASWQVPEVFDLLGEHGIGFRIHDLATGSYHGEYGRHALAPWTRKMISWTRGGHDVCAYFDNDWEAKATVDAARLRRHVERLTGERVLADRGAGGVEARGLSGWRLRGAGEMGSRFAAYAEVVAAECAGGVVPCRVVWLRSPVRSRRS